MTFILAAVGGLVLLLLGLKLFAKAKARPPKPAARAGMDYRTSASDIELYVVEAENWWPHLRVMPLFWVSAAATLILLALDFHFGYSRAGWYGLAILGSLFAIADLAIPFVAIRDAVDDGKRSGLGMALLAVFTVMSYVVVIGSTAEISTTTGAKNEVGVSQFTDLRKLMSVKQAERDSIAIDRGAEALGGLAKAEEEKAAREGSRTRCGPLCEQYTKAAADYRAREKEQIRKEKLTGEIERIKGQLSAGGTDSVRMDSDPLASAVSELSLGYISRDGVQRYGLTVLGVCLVTAMTVMWIVVGGLLKDEIAWELTYRGEIADEARASLGLAAKYGALATAPKALPAPTTSAAEDPSVILNVQITDMLKRFANDAELIATNGLFGTLMDRADGGSVTISDLYKAYRISVLSADPNARYMTQPVMSQKIAVITQHRDDVRRTADGIIHGWILKAVADRKLEVSADA